MDDSRDFAQSAVFHPKKCLIGRFEAKRIQERKPVRAFRIRQKARSDVLGCHRDTSGLPDRAFITLQIERTGILRRYPFLPIFHSEYKRALRYSSPNFSHCKIEREIERFKRIEGNEASIFKRLKKKILPNIKSTLGSSIFHFYYVFLCCSCIFFCFSFHYE